MPSGHQWSVSNALRVCHSGVLECSFKGAGGALPGALRRSRAYPGISGDHFVHVFLVLTLGGSLGGLWDTFGAVKYVFRANKVSKRVPKWEPFCDLLVYGVFFEN